MVAHSILAWRIPCNLMGYSPQACKESDTTEVTEHTHDKWQSWNLHAETRAPNMLPSILLDHLPLLLSCDSSPCAGPIINSLNSPTGSKVHILTFICGWGNYSSESQQAPLDKGGWLQITLRPPQRGLRTWNEKHRRTDICAEKQVGQEACLTYSKDLGKFLESYILLHVKK